MTIRERIETAFRGGMPDQVPWTIYRGMLPDTEVSQRLYAQGLGIVTTHPACVMATPHVEVTSEPAEDADGPVTVQTYHTPVGDLTQRIRVERGYGSGWTIDHLIKGVADYEVLEFIIRDTTYRPDYEGYRALAEQVGDRGIVMSGVSRVPLQRMWIQYTGIARLTLDLHDHPGVVEGVLAAMAEKDREHWAILADSPAEFIWCPDNITGIVTGPPWFDRYCAPHYHDLAALMHPRGKRLVAHMDGRMRRLVDSVRRVPVDVIEAFTPSPDGDLSVAEARAAWPDKVLSLNFPSSVHLSEPEQIRAMTRQLLREAAPGAGFALGVTENIPATRWERSITAITEVVNEAGRCPLEER